MQTPYHLIQSEIKRNLAYFQLVRAYFNSIEGAGETPRKVISMQRENLFLFTHGEKHGSQEVSWSLQPFVRRRVWSAANPSTPEASCNNAPGSGSRVTLIVSEYLPSSKWAPSKGTALNPVMPMK